MCAKLGFLVVCAVFLFVLVESSPIKEKDIDDIIFRLAEMRDDLHLDGANGSESERHHYSVHNSGKHEGGDGGGEEITDSDRNRLLYDYFVNPIGRYHGKRDFDEIDRWGFDSAVEKRNFDEIDRFGFSKRSPRRIPGHIYHRLLQQQQKTKRNLDEIDRYGFSDLKGF